MLIEAFVKDKINENTFECIIAIGKNFTRLQLITLLPINKKNTNFSIDDILYKAIYIWKKPYFKENNSYLGKIIYTEGNKIYVINQKFEEIFKRIE